MESRIPTPHSYRTLNIGIALMLLCSVDSFQQSRSFRAKQQCFKLSSEATCSAEIVEEHVNFLRDVARTEPPKKLELLLQLLEMSDDEKIVAPTERKGMNPFLVPLSRRETDDSTLCYMRWPTQKDGMDLQLVRTTNSGIYLVAMGTDQYCHRLAVEQDFFCLPSAGKALELLNASGQVNISLNSLVLLSDYHNLHYNYCYTNNSESSSIGTAYD
jgi:hypothetical protein